MDRGMGSGGVTVLICLFRFPTENEVQIHDSLIKKSYRKILFLPVQWTRVLKPFVINLSYVVLGNDVPQVSEMVRLSVTRGRFV